MTILPIAFGNLFYLSKNGQVNQQAIESFLPFNKF